MLRSGPKKSSDFWMSYLILNRHPTIVGVLHIYLGELCPLVAVTSLRSLGRGHLMWAMKNPWFFIGYIRDHTIQLYGDYNKALERSLLNNQYTSWKVSEGFSSWLGSLQRWSSPGDPGSTSYLCSLGRWCPWGSRNLAVPLRKPWGR